MSQKAVEGAHFGFRAHFLSWFFGEFLSRDEQGGHSETLEVSGLYRGVNGSDPRIDRPREDLREVESKELRFHSEFFF